MNKRVNMILNSIEGITLVDFNLLLEDTDFRKLFLELFNNKENDSFLCISFLSTRGLESICSLL